MTNPTTESTKRVPTGEWSETMASFWCSNKDGEYTSFKGSQQVHVYPVGQAGEKLPVQIIQHDQPILTISDFTDALEYGRAFNTSYRAVSAPDPNQEMIERYDRRIKECDANAQKLKDQHEGRVAKPAPPVGSLEWERQKAAGTLNKPVMEFTYDGGRALGFWEGRASTFADMKEELEKQ